MSAAVKTIVLYHAGCYDGFTAAWAARRALGNSAEYIPVSYGTEPPWERCRKAQVYIVDFSYPRNMLTRLHRMASGLQVYDHHKTAQKELEGLEYCTFDMSKSGARLAWEAFNGDALVPPIVKYVEDRDLWKWELVDSEEVNAALQSYDFDFQTWDDFDAMTDFEFLDTLTTEGEALLRNMRRTVTRAAEDALFLWFTFGDKSRTVPVVNANAYQSELGNYLAGEKGHGMAMLWHLAKSGEIKVSLRSVGDYFDVSDIARSFGGGGHPNAAGFSMDAETFYGWLLRGEFVAG